MDALLFDTTQKALASSMNMRLLRHNVISSNVANAETPGYKAKKMDFEDALARAIDLDGMRRMNTSSSEHFSVGGGRGANKIDPEIYDNPTGQVSPDGNTVDMEAEMALMSENALLFRATQSLINKKMAALKYAIQETR